MVVVLLVWSFLASGLGMLFGIYLLLSPAGSATTGLAFLALFGAIAILAALLTRGPSVRRPRAVQSSAPLVTRTTPAKRGRSPERLREATA